MVIFTKAHAFYKSLTQKDVYRLLGMLVLVGAVIGLGYVSYSWYIRNREERAQSQFSDCMQEYMEAYFKQTAWSSAEELSRLGYEQNARSYMAPYFLALQADVLLQQNKKQEASAVFDTMFKHISSSSPLYYIYALKRALLALDIEDTQGLEHLRALAYDKANPNRDAALYYLGLYHWSKDSFEQAQESWQELVEWQNASKTESIQSPWVAAARIKLQQIV